MEKDHPNVAFFPPLGAAVALVLIGALSWLAPLASRGGTMLSLAPLGYILIVAGGVIALSAIWAFRQAGTHVEPHKPALTVVSGGPYRFTRNPMYLGLLTVVLGLSLIFFDVLWALVGTGLFALALHVGVVLREEAYLTAKFGREYRELLTRTRRWL